MKEREGDPLQAQLNEVNRRLGELMMENELLRIKGQPGTGFSAGEVEEMSATISPSTGLRYGLRRVCRIWGGAPSHRLLAPPGSA